MLGACFYNAQCKSELYPDHLCESMNQLTKGQYRQNSGEKCNGFASFPGQVAIYSGQIRLKLYEKNGYNCVYHMTWDCTYL